MARITYVKSAQPRFKTVPVLTENGEPKKVPVINSRTGEQKVTKRGKPVFRKVTKPDLSQPLPLNKCECCGKEIKVGDSYKHVTPKSSAYGGRTRYRCASCPSWMPWDLSQSLSARIQQIQHDNPAPLDAESADDFSGAADNAAEAIRELAEEKRESAENMESGFGHSTSASEDLAQVADDLEAWADEMEQISFEDAPDEADYDQDADDDEGSEQSYEDALEDWRDRMTQEYEDVLEQAPC